MLLHFVSRIDVQDLSVVDSIPSVVPDAHTNAIQTKYENENASVNWPNSQVQLSNLIVRVFWVDIYKKCL